MKDKGAIVGVAQQKALAKEADASQAKMSAKRKKESTRKRASATRDVSSAAGEHNVDLGRRGEDAAARFLHRRGYDIVKRNWVCVAGEADIIARDGEWVVFVEVKTRSSCDKGFPSEAVDAAKRERYERIAALFLKDYDVTDVPVRFDVVSIMVIAPDRAMIRHHLNAFST